MSAAWYCFHYLPTGWMTPVANCHRCQKHKQNWWQNLPLVSLIRMANLPPVSLIPAAILPPVSLTPVVHLDLRIYPQSFEKIWNDPSVIFRSLGEGDSWKKTWSKKSCDTVPLRKGSKYICLQNLGSKLYLRKICLKNYFWKHLPSTMLWQHIIRPQKIFYF